MERFRRSVRDYGAYQLTVVTIGSVYGLIPVMWTNVAFIFIAPMVGHVCNHEELGTNFNESTCRLPSESANFTNASCTDFVYDHSQFDWTATEKFDLVCERRWLVPMVGSTYMVGYFFGALGSGVLSDKFGRRTILLAASASGTLIHLLSALAPDIWIYLSARFLNAVVDMAFGTTNLVMSNELVNKDQRLVGNFAELFFINLAYALLGAFIMLVSNFEYYHYFQTATYAVLFAMVYTFMYESPRWLAARGRNEEATETAARIATRNKRRLEDVKYLYELKSEKMDGGNVFDLFRFPNMRKRTLVLAPIWCAIVLGWHAIAYNLSSFTDDVRLGTIISGLIEAPLTIFLLIGVRKLGRQLCIFLCLLTAGIACVSMTPLVGQLGSPLLPVLALIGKLCLAYVLSLAYIYTPELYPTNLRQTGLGFSSTVSRVAGILAPQLALLNDTWPPFTVVTLGSTTILAAGLVPLLPDTSGTVLAQTLEEGEEFGRKHGYKLVCSTREKKRRRESRARTPKEMALI